RRLGKWLDSNPPKMQRELSLSPDMARAVRAFLDDGRRNFVRDCAEFIDVVEPPKADDVPATKKRS
ncbi:hypothetical protein, partial [Lacticaseibacillus paracasei]|uniref:hypothetical protein n=1 Tax=Lacticaseibacillus paracasei TaxID=1597 RepID=UPI0019523262